ncbi:hypothetical protein ACWDEW_47360, partial [Streptomyces sp. NPDC001100]
MSWPSGCRRLHRRYERTPGHSPSFTSTADSPIDVATQSASSRVAGVEHVLAFDDLHALAALRLA